LPLGGVGKGALGTLEQASGKRPTEYADRYSNPHLRHATTG
jgi:hypothetical protein